jgi:hypothetical protein
MKALVIKYLGGVILLSSLCCSDREKTECYVLDLNDYKLKSHYDDVLPKTYTKYKLTKDDLETILTLWEGALAKSRTERISTEYGRQYLAGIDSSGQVLVFINSFCHPENYDYRDKYLVVVSDGGDCFFRLLIDLTKKQVISFETNGSA